MWTERSLNSRGRRGELAGLRLKVRPTLPEITPPIVRGALLRCAALVAYTEKQCPAKDIFPARLVTAARRLDDVVTFSLPMLAEQSVVASLSRFSQKFAYLVRFVFHVVFAAIFLSASSIPAHRPSQPVGNKHSIRFYAPTTPANHLITRTIPRYHVSVSEPSIRRAVC